MLDKVRAHSISQTVGKVGTSKLLAIRMDEDMRKRVMQSSGDRAEENQNLVQSPEPAITKCPVPANSHSAPCCNGSNVMFGNVKGVILAVYTVGRDYDKSSPNQATRSVINLYLD